MSSQCIYSPFTFITRRWASKRLVEFLSWVIRDKLMATDHANEVLALFFHALYVHFACCKRSWPTISLEGVTRSPFTHSCQYICCSPAVWFDFCSVQATKSLSIPTERSECIAVDSVSLLHVIQHDDSKMIEKARWLEHTGLAVTLGHKGQRSRPHG